MNWFLRKARWLVALALFWGIWISFPWLTISLYDGNLWGLKAVAKVVALLPYGSVADGLTQLLDGWVALVKMATKFFKGYGGERTELIVRTLAFEGLLFWWECKLLIKFLWWYFAGRGKVVS